jgi:hypothetical protein
VPGAPGVAVSMKVAQSLGFGFYNFRMFFSIY